MEIFTISASRILKVMWHGFPRKGLPNSFRQGGKVDGSSSQTSLGPRILRKKGASCDAPFLASLPYRGGKTNQDPLPSPPLGDPLPPYLLSIGH